MKSENYILPLIAILVASLSYIAGNAFAQYSWLGNAGLAIGILLIGYWLFLERKNVVSASKSPSGRLGTQSGVTTVIGILVAIGLAVLTSRPTFNKSVDVSKSGVNTLSDQSVKIVKKIVKSGETITVTAFFQDMMQKSQFDDVIKLYERSGNAFSIEHVNPEMNPQKAISHNITSANTVIFSNGDREQRVTTFSEEKITNALVAVLKAGSKKVYFTTGHGEGKLEGQDAAAFDIIVGELNNNKYVTEPLSIIEKGSIPADADLVVVAGPQYELKTDEVAILKNYLENGGAVLVMADAMTPTEGLNNLTSEYGVTFNNDWLILNSNDLRAALLGQNNAAVSKFDEFHPLTKDIVARGQVDFLFPNSRSLSIDSDNNKKANVEAVGETADSVILVKNVNSKHDVKKIEQDRIETGKNFPVIAVATLKIAGQDSLADNANTGSNEKSDAQEEKIAPEKEARLVVVGSSQFATNLGAQRAENRDLFANMTSYLLADEDFISIRPKDAEKGRLDLNSPSAGFSRSFLAFIYPFLFLGGGIFVWLRRRSA